MPNEITFRIQKNHGQVEDQIAQWYTHDNDLCPVKHWADTITRLRSYPNYDNKWPVYYYHDQKQNKASNISSKEIFDERRAAVDAIGPHILGFSSKDVGTHSNRAPPSHIHNDELPRTNPSIYDYAPRSMVI